MTSRVDNIQVAHELLLTMKQARCNLLYREPDSILNEYDFEEMHTLSTEYLSANFSAGDLQTFTEPHVLMIPAHNEIGAQLGFVWQYGVEKACNVALFYDMASYEEEEDDRDYR